MKASAILRWAGDWFELPGERLCRSSLWLVGPRGVVTACTPQGATRLAEGSPGCGAEANRYLDRAAPAGFGGAADWAGREGRTKREVVELFRAAERLAAREGA